MKKLRTKKVKESEPTPKVDADRLKKAIADKEKIIKGGKPVKK